MGGGPSMGGVGMGHWVKFMGMAKEVGPDPGVAVRLGSSGSDASGVPGGSGKGFPLRGYTVSFFAQAASPAIGCDSKQRAL